MFLSDDTDSTYVLYVTTLQENHHVTIYTYIVDDSVEFQYYINPSIFILFYSLSF